jgi:sortase A
MIKLSRNVILLVSLMGLSGGVIAGQGVYLKAKATVAQYLLESAWEESIKIGRGVVPWSWADTKPLARLVFSSQKKTFIILEGSSGRTLAFAPGHLTGSTSPTSSLPLGKGHIIISGHRDTHFSLLEQSAIEDVLMLESIDKTKRYYQIQSIKVIDTRKELLILEPGKGLLTLITCYPFDAVTAGSPFRYRIDAVTIPDPNSIGQL